MAVASYADGVVGKVFRYRGLEVTVGREKGEICQYHNFKLAGKVSMDPAVNACMDHMTFTVGDDPTGEYAKFYNLLMNMDDFLVFGDALTETDVAKLAEYYHQD